jgi:hypothetical protein
VTSDLDAQEMAQLGLKKIEDAIVSLLSRRAEGLNTEAIADELGLGAGLPPDKRGSIASAVLGLLVQSGRVLWDEQRRVYLDNPEKV